jgi:hypothetical protein
MIARSWHGATRPEDERFLLRRELTVEHYRLETGRD